MPKVQPLERSTKFGRTIVDKLGRKVDKVRQLATTLGTRPYRCFLVHRGWNGEERGEGEAKELRRVEVLPTPKVSSMDALTRNPFRAGVYPVGTVRVDEVSTAYTEDQLSGLDYPKPDEPEVPATVEFYWELVPDGRQGGDVRPQKYRLATQPNFAADNVMWELVLERVQGDPAPRKPSGPDVEDD